MDIRATVLGLVALMVLLPLDGSAQVLETEDARPLAPGSVHLGAAFEFQTSADGIEMAVPLSWEQGLSRRLTLLIEPVCYTNIQPQIGGSATGLGDLEATLLYRLAPESGSVPSISVSAEVKIPTARNVLIGTQKTDLTAYLIGSKTAGRFFTSANFSYTFTGKPSGTAAQNTFNYALGTIFTASRRSILFAEVYGNTSAGGSEAPERTPGPAGSAELSGGELVGAFGYGCWVKRNLLLSFGISYDNNRAILLRPGVEWSFGGE